MEKVSKTLLSIFVSALITGIPLTAETKVWEEDLEIPTWEIGPPEVNPIFAWTSERSDVYPYPYKEILTSNKTSKTYRACWLENEFIKVLVLPEIGGRLHGAKDKTNDYNFFYWQPTIKPGLVGMTGAWISGGIEWNFPHGHRPTGFSPVQYRLVENSDGSKTVWVGETEWVFRMRWIVGLTIYPGKSVIEAKVRLFNPTPLRHSFQMWTTTATNANDNYEAVFPTRLMTGHGKHEYWHWPVDKGVNISWWKNVPNAASFFAVEPGDFFGAWDHGELAGTVITGNPRIVVGKKFWTWGTAPFGRIWEPKLTDGEGPYLEPQAGAYSDNQPDYHWIEPGEVKSYSHFFYPVRDIGLFNYANVNGALNLEVHSNRVKMGVYSTSSLKAASVQLQLRDQTVFEKQLDLDPSAPFVGEVEVPQASEQKKELTLRLLDANGNVLVSYRPEELDKIELPEPVKPHPAPDTVETVDELWHHGDLVYKFRDPENSISYFEEALRRDPGNTRSHISLAELKIKRADYETALKHLEVARERDPDNGRIFYLKAIALDGLGKYESAYDAYYRSVHFEDYLARAYQRIAYLDLRKGAYSVAAIHSQRAIEKNLLNSKLWALNATALRLSGKLEQAEVAVKRALDLDPIDPWAANEQRRIAGLLKGDSQKAKDLQEQLFQWDPHLVLETALEYANAGLYSEASDLVRAFVLEKKTGFSLAHYYLAYFEDKMGNSRKASDGFAAAMAQPVDYVFSFRTEAIEIFESALGYNPEDAAAHYYLGLVYAKLGNLDNAIANWEKSVQLKPDNPRAWRNLGLALSHNQKDPKRSLECYEKAFSLAENDSRILLELDDVRKELGLEDSERLRLLKQHRTTVESRDDLLKSMLDLMLQAGEHEEALQYFSTHHFKLWEGRYDIHNAFIDANLALARSTDSPEERLKYYEKACQYPANLEVAPREPNLRGFLYYPMAQLHRQLGNEDEATRLLKITAEETSDSPTLGSYYQALALRDLGEKQRADAILIELRNLADSMRKGEATDYRWESPDLQKALGLYYSAKLEEVDGDTVKSDTYLLEARALEPTIERQAIIIAQLVFARAHQ